MARMRKKFAVYSGQLQRLPTVASTFHRQRRCFTHRTCLPGRLPLRSPIVRRVTCGTRQTALHGAGSCRGPAPASSRKLSRRPARERGGSWSHSLHADTFLSKLSWRGSLAAGAVNAKLRVAALPADEDGLDGGVLLRRGPRVCPGTLLAPRSPAVPGNRYREISTATPAWPPSCRCPGRRLANAAESSRSTRTTAKRTTARQPAGPWPVIGFSHQRDDPGYGKNKDESEDEGYPRMLSPFIALVTRPRGGTRNPLAPPPVKPRSQ